MNTSEKEIEQLKEDVAELKFLVSKIIPFDEDELKPSVRNRLREIKQEEPTAEYQPGCISKTNED